MFYELNGRKNICIFGNAITFQIILGNNILRNNDLPKVTSNSPKKGMVTKLKEKVQFQKLM